MTPYMTVRDTLAPCRTMAELSQAWARSQPALKAMDQGQRAALGAMKDFYKGLIQRGHIDDYLTHRSAAAAKSWPGVGALKRTITRTKPKRRK